MSKLAAVLQTIGEAFIELSTLVPDGAVGEAAPAPKPRTRTKPKEEPEVEKASAKTAETPDSGEEDPAPVSSDGDNEEDEGEVSLSDLQTLGAKLIKAGRREDLKKLLAKLKVSALSEIDKADRPDVVKKMEDLVNAGDE